MARIRLATCIFFVLLLGTLGFFMQGAPLPAQAQSGNKVWSYVFNTPLAYLGSVFMTDQNSAWVVGGEDNYSYVAKIHWDGSNWQTSNEAYLQNTHIGKISVISDNNIWATGGTDKSDGILHYNGKDWKSVPIPPVSAIYSAIQMLGNGEEGWAAGGIWPGQVNPNQPWRPIILHYSGGQWEQVLGIEGEDQITSVHFTADSGWAVSASAIWHYQNGVWAKENMPPWCPDTTCYGGYTAVRAISADEAWAVGWRTGTCGICTSVEFAAHRVGGKWSEVLPTQPLIGALAEPLVPALLNDVTFTNPNNGWSGGVYSNRDTHSAETVLLIHYEDGAWSNVTMPDLGEQNGTPVLQSISAFDSDHAIAVGSMKGFLAYGYGSQPPAPSSTPAPTPYADPPTFRVADPQRSEITYFPLVGHTLRGGFRDFWQGHGGLEQFGYPITEEYNEVSATNGRSYVTQWFERARMEWHPGEGLAIDVQLGLLGRDVTKGRENELTFKPVPTPTQPNVIYFKETGHTLAPELATYWQTTGGLPVYGFPISEPFMETSKTDGKQYLVQYFERNRLEYHPEAPNAYRVQLGLLGVDLLRARGWLP